MPYEKFIMDLLNIEPEKIESVQTIEKEGAIKVLVKMRVEPHSCPACGGQMHVHGYSERKITHSTLVNRPCEIIYSQRRWKCVRCGMTSSEANPFSKGKERLSYETRANILDLLKEPRATYVMAARMFNTTSTTVQRIFDRCVDIPRKPLPEVLSIDEHYFPESSFDSLYMCILMDFDTGNLIDILPDRRKEELIRYFSNIRNETLSKDGKSSELSNVKFISIDLYENYREIARSYFPHAVVCADSFHVIENLNKCFDEVRLRCRRKADPDMAYFLTKFRFTFNFGMDLDNVPRWNRRLGRYANLRDIQMHMFNAFPDLKEAYGLKESYIAFNKSANVSNARELLMKQIEAFGNTELKEFRSFYGLLLNWSEEIISSFTMYEGKRINNSIIESRNRIIETILYNANGCTSFKRTRNRILYCTNRGEKPVIR